jgi:Pyruvate/2-oxoacid:ferredoxin oxidoreductase gamma subunit
MNEINDVFNTGEMKTIKIKLRETEEQLKELLQQRVIKEKRAAGYKENASETLAATSAVERLMLAVFYNELQLGAKVRKYIIGEKTHSSFEKKKASIKSKFTNEDILIYLQLSKPIIVDDDPFLPQ